MGEVSPRERDQMFRKVKKQSQKLLEKKTTGEITTMFEQAKAELAAGNTEKGFALKDSAAVRLQEYCKEVQEIQRGVHTLSELGDVRAFVTESGPIFAELETECDALRERFESEWQEALEEKQNRATTS